MPVYNAESFLVEAIRSILNQTFTDFEFLILDDASSDRSLEIIQKYAKKDSRIKIFQNKENQGEGFCRNKLVAETKTIYIAWMDSDDISLPDRYQKQIDFLEKNLDIDVVGCGTILFNEKKERLSSVFISDWAIKSAMLLINPIEGPTTMVRISKQKHPYDKSVRISPDYLYWLSNATSFCYHNLPEFLYRYRINQQGITASEKIPYEKHFLMLKAHLKIFGIAITKQDFLTLRGQNLKASWQDYQRGFFILKKMLALKNFYGYQGVHKKSILKIYGKYFLKQLLTTKNFE